jgi:tetratricopeptide (TPR) repeat protein
MLKKVLFAIVLTASAMPAAAQENGYALTRARTLYDEMRDDGACEAVLPEARSFAASSDFATLSADVRSTFLWSVLHCATVLRDVRGALEAADAAKALGAPWADRLRLAIALDFHDDALAVSSFFDFATSAPDDFRHMSLSMALKALQAAHRQDPSDFISLRMHTLLADWNYAPPEGSDEVIRVEHARLLLRSGAVAAARQRLGAVVDVRRILEIRVDRAFDALRNDASFEQRMNIAAAANASLDHARQLSAEQPGKLTLVIDVAQQLRALGRMDEALSTLNGAIAAAEAPNAAQRFDYLSEQLNWLLNEKAYVLYDLGRVQEAHDVFGSAIALGEGGQWNVSQIINFASMLNDEGRGADALEVVRTVGQASSYGDMWAAAVRACGAEQVHNVHVRDEALAFLRAHEADNRSALAQGLLCVNDLDGAAALYIRRLASPSERGDALIALQRYLRRDNPALPHRALMLDRLAAVRDRADVRAAVEAVGRIEDVPLYTTYWGDV